VLVGDEQALAVFYELKGLSFDEQRRHFQFTIYENSKKYCFQLPLLGLIGLRVGNFTSHGLIIYLSVGEMLSLLQGILFIVIN